jgi:hypothetical protein
VVLTRDLLRSEGCSESAARQRIGDRDRTGDRTSPQTHRRRTAAEAKTSPVSGTPLADNQIAHSALPRRRSERVQERRSALILCSGILFVVGLGFALVMPAQLPMSSKLATSLQPVIEAPPHNELSSVKVTIDSADGSGCRQRVLDNQTWRMTQSQQPCGPDRDVNGIARPTGTIHRLDAISKSFLGK